MPRARKHAHSRYKPLEWNPGEYAHPDLHLPQEQVFDPRILTNWRRQAGRLAGQPKTKLAWPSAARDSDPLTVTLLLDGILRTNPDAYLNAGNLTDHFTRDEAQYTQVLWNPTVVGRLLSSLMYVAQEVTIPNGGQPMIDKVTWGGQRNYVIQPDIHTWQWLGALREHFGQLTAKAIEESTLNQEPARFTAVEIWTDFRFDYGAKPERKAA